MTIFGEFLADVGSVIKPVAEVGLAFKDRDIALAQIERETVNKRQEVAVIPPPSAPLSSIKPETIKAVTIGLGGVLVLALIVALRK